MTTQRRDENESGVATQERTRHRVQRPRLYRVLLHNDDYTPMDFVVQLLQTLFHRDETDATRIMLHVHQTGIGVAGVYTREIAETKVLQVHLLARKGGHPLMASAEPEEPEEDEDAQ